MHELRRPGEVSGDTIVAYALCDSMIEEYFVIFYDELDVIDPHHNSGIGFYSYILAFCPCIFSRESTSTLYTNINAVTYNNTCLPASVHGPLPTLSCLFAVGVIYHHV